MAGQGSIKRSWRGGAGAMALVAVLLAGFVAYLVFANYASAERMQRSLREQALSDAQQQAQPLRDFVIEQSNTVSDLALSPEVVGFFENRALGMSMEYGLRQSLLLIAERFEQMRERRRHGARHVFASLALLDSSGGLLTASPAQAGHGIADASVLASAASTTYDPDQSVLHVSVPVLHRARNAGAVVASIDADMLWRIAGCGLLRDHRAFLVSTVGAHRPVGPSERADLPSGLPADLSVPRVLDLGYGDQASLISIAPVPGLPFVLVTQHASESYLGAAPLRSLVATILLATLLLGIAIVLVIQVLRSRRLNEMLGEMRIREAIESERNRANLDRERTARTQAEEEATQLGYAVEQASEAVVILDTDGVIRYVNDAFVRSSGWSRQEAVGRTQDILRSELHDQAFYDAMWADLRAGRSWQGRIVNRRRKDGSLLHEDVTISPVRDAEGGIRRFIAVKRDVTSILRMEEQLRQAQKLESIGQLAAGIAHEINTPIQFIGDNLRFLSDGFAELRESARGSAVQSGDMDYLLAEIPKALAESRDGIQRVAQIVLAMKEFSHPNGQALVPTDINHAIASTITVSRNEWKYVAEMRQELAPDLPLVPLLVGDFNQAMLNLIVNAAHAIEERRTAQRATALGCIVISTRIVDGMVEVRVGDDGCGIPDHIRHRIFEPFFTTKGVGKGTGQGLPLAHAVVVKRLGGSIDFESSVGVGTTFILRLPLKSPAQA